MNIPDTYPKGGTMNLDITKPVQTRGGLPARIVCTDRRSFLPVMALVLDACGTESLVSLTKDFKCTVCSASDLINVPEKRTLDFWVNIYPQPRQAYLYASKADADIYTGSDRIDCVHIVQEYVVGEGLK